MPFYTLLLFSCAFSIRLRTISDRFFFRYFTQFSEPDFARSGTPATQRVVISEGPLTSFSHSMEPQLRQLGLPTTLVKGTGEDCVFI